MIHLTVLDVLRDMEPEMLSAGQIKGKLLEQHPDVTHEMVLQSLKQLESTGMIAEVGGAGEGASLWRVR
jgi:hypothetical protein